MAIDHSKQFYYGALKRRGMFLAHVFHYDVTGNQKIVFWQSDKSFTREELAVDCAAQYVEEHKLELEFGEVQLSEDQD